MHTEPPAAVLLPALMRLRKDADKNSGSSLPWRWSGCQQHPDRWQSAHGPSAVQMCQMCPAELRAELSPDTGLRALCPTQEQLCRGLTPPCSLSHPLTMCKHGVADPLNFPRVPGETHSHGIIITIKLPGLHYYCFSGPVQHNVFEILMLITRLFHIVWCCFLSLILWK